MSYILDALKKSDVQRQVGNAPPEVSREPLAAPGGKQRRRRLLPWAILGGVTTLVIIAAIPWYKFGLTVEADKSATANSTTRDSNRMTSTLALPVSAPVVSPRASADSLRKEQASMRRDMLANTPAGAATVVTTTTITTTAQPTLIVEPAIAKTARKSASTSADKPPEPHIAAARNPVEAPITIPDSAAIEPPVTALPADIPGREKLPESLRTQLPRLSISVIIYSRRATNRRTRIDGRMYFEGDQLAQALTLREIRPNSVVLDADGTLFKITQ